MGRNKKDKIILKNPKYTYYKPPGIGLRDLNEQIISIEEFEAMRLKDFENKDQTTCAQIMEIHQSTFQRLLVKARKKLIGAIIEGSAIKIEGGNFKLNKNEK